LRAKGNKVIFRLVMEVKDIEYLFTQGKKRTWWERIYLRGEIGKRINLWEDVYVGLIIVSYYMQILIIR